jgi:hypothetical protein
MDLDSIEAETHTGGTMTTCKTVNGTLGQVRLQAGEFGSFVVAGHYVEVSCRPDGTAQVMVDDRSIVTTIHEETGGDD